MIKEIKDRRCSLAVFFDRSRDEKRAERDVLANCDEKGAKETKNRTKEPRKISRKPLQKCGICGIIFQIETQAEIEWSKTVRTAPVVGYPCIKVMLFGSVLQEFV